MKKENDFRGSNIHNFTTYTQKSIEEILRKDLAEQCNSSIRIPEKGICINTSNKMETFSVYTFEKEKPHFFEMVSDYFQIESLETLSSVIADFSMEKLESFEKDHEYSLKKFIFALTTEQKDLFLYNLLKEKQNNKKMEVIENE